MPKIVDSNAEAAKGLTFIVGAQAKTGKTFFAASGSEFFSTTKSLDDMYFLQFDPGGIRGLVEAGYKIPHGWDLSAVDVKTLPVELDKAMEDIAALGKTGKLKIIIIDTISELASRAERYAGTVTKGQDVWTVVAGVHTKLIHTLAQWPAHKVYLTHWKESYADETAKKASGLAGEASDIVIAVSGKAANTYVATADVIGRLALTGKDKRTFFPHAYKGYQGGSRLKCLDENEPADLAAIIKKCQSSVRRENT